MATKEVYAELDMSSYKEFQKEFGFDGRNQLFFTQEVYKFSGPYTPSSLDDEDKSPFIANVAITPEYIHYLSLQALYLWNGKLMVDPITEKGAFFSESYGFWSRPNTLKKLTDKDLNFTGSPMRGSHWTDRMWADKSKEIVSTVQKFINNGGKT